MSDQLALQQIVEQAFNRATAEPTLQRWRSCSVVAGCAAVRMAAEGNDFMAASLEGVAEEARRRMLDLMPKAVSA